MPHHQISFIKIFIPCLLLVYYVSAFPSNPTLSSLPTNTAKDLGAYAPHCGDSTADPDNCRRIGDYSRFAYDPEHHQILFFGGGHATTMRDDVDVFDFATLTWKSAYKSTPCSLMTIITSDGTWSSTGHPVARHTYDQLIYAPNAHGLFITSPVYGAGYCGTFGGCGEWCAGKMLFYDPVAKTWTAKTTATNAAHVVSSEYDPVSGRIISAGGPGLSTYDPLTDTKTQYLSSSSITDYADNLVYFPPNDKFYYFSRGNPVAVYAVTLDRTNWASSTIQAVTGMSGTARTDETGWAYDSANHVIGGGVTNDTFYAYDPVANSMSAHAMTVQGGGTGPTCYFHCLEFDPVDQVFILYGADFHTWAYCYVRKPAGVRNGDVKTMPPLGITVRRAGQSLVICNHGEAGSIRVISLDGRIIAEARVSGHSTATIKMPTRGVYVLQGKGGAGVLSGKLVYSGEKGE